MVSVQYTVTFPHCQVQLSTETSFPETDVYDTIRVFYSQTNHISVPVITLMRTQENIVKAYFLQQLLCPSNFLQKFPSQATLNTSAQRVSNSSTRSVLDCLDLCTPPSSSSPASYDQQYFDVS